MSDILERRARAPDASGIYWFENRVLAIAALVGLIIVLLLLGEGKQLRSAGSASAGRGFIYFAFVQGGVVSALVMTIFRQWRVRFTIDQPAPLVPYCGQSAPMSVDNLQTAIRNGARPVALELAWPDFFLRPFSRLDMAPIQVQLLVQAYLRNVVMIVIIGVGYALCMFLIDEPNQQNVISVFYALLLLLCAFRVGSRVEQMAKAVIALTAAIALGLPVVLQTDLALQIPHGLVLKTGAPTGLMLVLFLAVAALFLGAVLTHIGDELEMRATGVDGRFSTKTPPTALFQELHHLSRKLGIDFSAGRFYVERAPKLQGTQGEYEALLLAESRPIPVAEELPGDLRCILETSRFRWVAALTLMAGGAWIAFFITSFKLAQPIAVSGEWPLVAWPIALASIAHFAQRTAHLLWSRIDFESWLLMATLEGHFQSVEMGVEPGTTGGIGTKKQVLETDNLRIETFVARVRSLSFGVVGDRTIIGFSEHTPSAQTLIDGAREFLGSQSSIAVPDQKKDIENAIKLGDINRLIKGKKPGRRELPPREDLPSLPEHPSEAELTPAATAPAKRAPRKRPPKAPKDVS